MRKFSVKISVMLLAGMSFWIGMLAAYYSGLRYFLGSCVGIVTVWGQMIHSYSCYRIHPWIY